MTQPILSGFVAVAIGVVLAAVFFVPYIALAYRKSGRVTFGRTLLWLVFLIYLLALWTYTLLPFPRTRSYRCLLPQLRLGATIDDIRHYGVATVREIVANPAVLQVGLNILLFLPLGFFLRWLTRRGWLTITGIGLGISALIELTQLTGVWHLYPCAYRLFDVDDLVSNTFGALLGALLSLPILLRKEHRTTVIDVSKGRRFLGAVCDWYVVVLIQAAITVMIRIAEIYILHVPGDETNSVWELLVAEGVSLIGLAIVTLASGRTPGDWAVNIRWEGTRKAGRLLRYIGGIGGYQLLGMIPSSTTQGWGSLFALVSLIVILATPKGRGLPGLLSGRVPVIDRRLAPDDVPVGDQAGTDSDSSETTSAS